MQSTKELAAALAADFEARLGAERNKTLDLLEKVIKEAAPFFEAREAAYAERAAAADTRLVVLEGRALALLERTEKLEGEMKALSVKGNPGAAAAPWHVLPQPAPADPEIERRLRELEERAAHFAPVSLR